MQIARVALPVMAWLFIALVAVQVFFAGLGLFGATDMALHRDFGYWVPLGALAVLLGALVGRAGARTIWLAGGLLVASAVQTALPVLRDDLPFIAALHPVNALLMFWLALVVARRAVALSQAPAGVSATSAADRVGA
ncbi:MAG TPA: DUF6220 domain-containing protein [Candidatus Limnocylindria bacterium]|nr:DUF6220 domain-containing protein [Candidatus Limnocylindria bacterium]